MRRRLAGGITCHGEIFGALISAVSAIMYSRRRPISYVGNVRASSYGGINVSIYIVKMAHANSLFLWRGGAYIMKRASPLVALSHLPVSTSTKSRHRAEMVCMLASRCQLMKIISTYALLAKIKSSSRLSNYS